MDAALKARQLGSAAARRQRLEERQLQHHIAHQEYIRRKHLIMADNHFLENSEDESDLEAPSNPDLDFVAETPLEVDVRTPDNSSTDVFITLSPSVYHVEAEVAMDNDESKEVEKIVSIPQIQPKMQATLTTMADWNYDRFSMFLDPSEVEEQMKEILIQEQEEQEDEDDDDTSECSSDEEPEPYSPIEIATPVSYVMPKVRPSVVSITTPQLQNKPFEQVIAVQKRPTPRRHVSEQLVADSLPTDIKVSQTRLFQASNSSRETVESSQDTNLVSRSTSVTSHNDSMISRSVSQASQSDQSQKSPKRKSSLPLLFGSKQSGHSRMSSLKKFIRSSTLGPPTSNQPFHSPLQRGTSSSMLETHFESRNGSLDVPRETLVEQPRRPMTARAPSPFMMTTDNITALPAPPTTAPPLPPSRPIKPEPLFSRNENEPTQTKAASKFRSRSGSFGQALKNIGGNGPKKADVHAPPVPTIMIPSASQQLDLDVFPEPPPLTPRNPRRSMANYSPFPAADKRTSTVPVGLGLRY